MLEVCLTKEMETWSDWQEIESLIPPTPSFPYWMLRFPVNKNTTVQFIHEDLVGSLRMKGDDVSDSIIK